MIQRKQSLWLFIAALMNAGVLYFDLYKTHTIVNGVDALGQLRVTDHYPSVIITMVMIFLPLVTIFMFRNRRQQMRMTAYSMVSQGTFISMLLIRVGKITPPPTSGTYGIGSILPVVAFVFLFMALMG